MALTHGVTLTLKLKNNGTNGFPVTENVGVEPLFGFISGQVTEIWLIFTCWLLTMTYGNMTGCGTFSFSALFLWRLF